MRLKGHDNDRRPGGHNHLESNDLETDISHSSSNFLDSPNTTSQLTYKIMIYSNGTVYINRPTTTADNWSVGVTQSSITLMEIAG